MKTILLAATLLIVGCRSSLELPPAPPAESPADLAYEIELAPEPSNEVRFTLVAPAAEDGVSTFAVDESWGGVEDAASLVMDLRVSRTSGEVLPLEHPQAHRWIAHGAPGEMLTVRWRLLANEFQADPDPRVHYKPMLGKRLLHLIGNLGLVRPEHLSVSEPRRIGVKWKGFAEAGWRTACSFSIDPRGFETLSTLDEFRHAVYLAGHLRIHELVIRGRPVAVAIAGDDWTFSNQAFVEHVRRILEAERAFFDDDDFPFYLVSLVPVGVPDPRSRSLGGTGLTQSFALFLQPDTWIGSESDSDQSVPRLLAHEMFHHWNGRIVEREEPEQLVYWFSEGFTDFYARRILYRAGYGGIEEYERSLNAALGEYALSPAREAENAEILEGFWRDRDVGRIPYVRGDVVGMLLDREIRSRSRGDRSLDDFMREAVRKGRAGEKVSTEVLLSRIAEWTDAKFADRVRSIVVDGEMAEISSEVFEPCFEVEHIPLGPFDAGFDVDRSREAKQVRGLRAGSAAERAGLREGQRLVGWSVTFGQPEIPIEMTIREDGEERVIQWLPQGDSVPVPRLILMEEADCSWL